MGTSKKAKETQVDLEMNNEKREYKNCGDKYTRITNFINELTKLESRDLCCMRQFWLKRLMIMIRLNSSYVRIEIVLLCVCARAPYIELRRHICGKDLCILDANSFTELYSFLLLPCFSAGALCGLVFCGDRPNQPHS